MLSAGPNQALQPSLPVDSHRLFSLICLLNQCVLAWIFAGFFGALLRGRAQWLASFFLAFVGLGIGLTAVVMRIWLSSIPETAGPELDEGALAVRALYGVYLAGKLLFVAGLVRGVLRWRDERPGGPAWLVAVIAVAAFVVGFVLPTIESVLLVQGPIVALACAYAASRLGSPGEQRLADAGRQTVRVVLAAMAVVWTLYVVATLFAGPVDPRALQPFGFLLRYNSLIDLTLQVVLATGLIVAVLSEAHARTLAAQNERDRLRSQVMRDDKLRVTATLISGVAHEINNPLTAIIGYADDLSSADATTRERAASIVREQAERCRAIVQRMSVIGRRRLLTTSTFGVRAKVEAVAAGFAPRCEEHEVAIEVDVDEGLHVTADATGFEQVLTNLVSNAIAVSPRGSAVVVRAESTENGMRLAVRDHGPGIAQTDRGRIFEPFWTTKRPNQGTGLGLAVADAIVHAHGGAIDIVDATGGGTEFVVLWPWRAPTSSESPLPSTRLHSQPEAAAAGGADQARMLIIDDEPLVRSMIRRHAENHGWQVDEVDCALEGLERLMADPGGFRAIVCDMRMPGMSGVEFHDELERRAPELLARTLFVTGDLASQEMAAFSQRCRAEIVTKPFVTRELVQRLADLAS
jgi:signal transduction histidine kinase